MPSVIREIVILYMKSSKTREEEDRLRQLLQDEAHQRYEIVEALKTAGSRDFDNDDNGDGDDGGDAEEDRNSDA